MFVFFKIDMGIIKICYFLFDYIDNVFLIFYCFIYILKSDMVISCNGLLIMDKIFDFGYGVEIFIFVFIFMVIYID